MYNPNRVERLRSQYPPGTRILLSEMRDPHSPVPPGTMGTVDMLDDGCNLLMTWDNGRTLSLIPGEDRFSIVEQKQEPVSMKLYMPLYCDLYLYDDRGSLEEYPEVINGQGALEYEDNILAASSEPPTLSLGSAYGEASLAPVFVLSGSNPFASLTGLRSGNGDDGRNASTFPSATQ